MATNGVDISYLTPIIISMTKLYEVDKEKLKGLKKELE